MASLQKGLIGHWTMDDADTSGGTVYDRSAGNNHGLLNNVNTGSSGIIGESFEFSNSNIDPGIDLEQDNISISSWFNTGVTGSNGIIWNIASGTFDGIGLRQSDSTVYVFDDTQYNTDKLVTDISLNEWVHTVVTLDSSTIKLYVNSVSSGTASQGLINTLPLSIGSRFSYGPIQLMFTGRIDDVRVYNRILSESEVSALYNMRSQRQQTSTLQKKLVGHWSMNDEDISNGVLYDSAAVNQPDAQINGNVTTGNVGSPVGQHTESGGNGDYIGTRYVLSSTLTNGFSASGWIKDIGNLGGGGGRFFSMDISDWWGFRRGGSAGRLQYHFRDSAGNAYVHEETVGTGNWFHVAGVWDHTVPEVRYYLDGSPVNTQSVSNPGFGTGFVTRYLILHDGSESSSYNTQQNIAAGCGLSDIRLWERPITEEEVKTVYNIRSNQ